MMSCPPQRGRKKHDHHQQQQHHQRQEHQQHRHRHQQQKGWDSCQCGCVHARGRSPSDALPSRVAEGNEEDEEEEAKGVVEDVTGREALPQEQQQQPQARRIRRKRARSRPLKVPLLFPALLLALARAPSGSLVAQAVSVAPECATGGVWAVNAAAVYSWTAAYPQSCVCEETGVSMTDCTRFDCPCICDLTAGKCDYNCCCDSECSSSEVARFTALSACVEEGPSDSSVTYCYDSDQLRSVNPSYPMSVSDTSEAALQGLLCVQYDNSHSKGRFFTDPGTFSAAIFSDSKAEKEFSFEDNADVTSSAGLTEGDATLDRGDRLPAAFLASGSSAVTDGVVSAFGGFMPLPASSLGGVCSERNYALFEEGQETACMRSTSALGQDCATAFGAYRYATDLYIGASGSVLASSSPSSSDFVKVELSSVTHRDFDTGEGVDFGSDLDCDTFYLDGSGSSSSPDGTDRSACTLPSGGTVATPASSASSASSTNVTDEAVCHNALKSVCYTVTHDGEGTVTAVAADVVVTDVPSSAADASTGVVGLEQTFRVKFESPANVTQTEAAGNLVERARSGNPGYLIGKPVVVGNLESESFVAAPVQGMSVMKGSATEGGKCTGDPSDRTTVTFGYDLMSCCSLTLNRTSLEEMCSGGGPYVQSDGFTPFTFNLSSFSLVGIYGSADPLDPSQWLDMSVSEGTGTSSWDESTGTCLNQMSSQHVSLLYTPVGAKANPQNKIVAAEAHLSKSPWRWSSEDREEQTFTLCTTVTFIRYEESSTHYTVPPPPLGLKLPWDVFYPFDISAAAAPSPRHWASLHWASFALSAAVTAAALWPLQQA